MARYIFSIVFASILTLFIYSGSLALEPPHDASNNINCEDCHAMHKSGGMMGGAVISRGAEQETLCKTCHLKGSAYCWRQCPYNAWRQRQIE